MPPIPSPPRPPPALGLTGYATRRLDGLSFRLSDREAFSDYYVNTPDEWRLFNRLGYPEKNHIECEFFDIEQFRAGHNTAVPRPGMPASCYQRAPARPKVVLIRGDSHAEHLSVVWFAQESAGGLASAAVPILMMTDMWQLK
ncbi:hypothetical protein [Duganella callida]|uniref:Uncharacterized protein n=1 Tax=Duganella callida TaxID=2561932 RepID=A0A4Y9S8X8_9BURK|nr:hypothetical protein [Duganella callida]TFW16559.1 hypothetical protein E4L98_23135 [Duganella callida]